MPRSNGSKSSSFGFRRRASSRAASVAAAKSAAVEAELKAKAKMEATAAAAAAATRPKIKTKDVTVSSSSTSTAPSAKRQKLQSRRNTKKADPVQPEQEPEPESKKSKSKSKQKPKTKAVMKCVKCGRGGHLVNCIACKQPYHPLCTGLREVPRQWKCSDCIEAEAAAAAAEEEEKEEEPVEPLPGPVDRILDWRFAPDLMDEEQLDATEETVLGLAGKQGEDCNDRKAIDGETAADGAGSGTNRHALAATAAQALAAALAVRHGTIAAEPTQKKENQRRQIRPREMYVKWRGRAFIHAEWVKEAQLAIEHPGLLRNFLRREELPSADSWESAGEEEEGQEGRKAHGETGEAGDKLGGEEEADAVLLEEYVNGVRPEWLRVQRVIAERTYYGNVQYLCKWTGLSYQEATWEDEEALHNQVEAIEVFRAHEAELESHTTTKVSRKAATIQWEGQPAFLRDTGLALHPYQLEGVNWLRYSWGQNINTILADEMGLGKTIQSVTFVRSLVREGHTRGPFLVVVPLSTLSNWEREFATWAPDLYVVPYAGNADSRQVIRDNEFYAGSEPSTKRRPGAKASRATKVKRNKMLRFNVLLTSYEMINTDHAVFSSVTWEALVVDEAHRLKNNRSKLFRSLMECEFKHRLLLTGTPLQNTLDELFHLLTFLNPTKFFSLEEFQEKFSDVSKEEQISRLHKILGRHLLRRLKADVLKDMPTKSEFIVCVDLAPLQKRFYKYILQRNFTVLNKKGAGGAPSLLNIMAELKKVCNHPYLFPAAEEEDIDAAEAAEAVGGITAAESESDPDAPNGLAWRRIQASGKLALLDKMLVQLKREGHRVLIFSQMTRLLDIIEDYLETRDYAYERIDGSVLGSERQQRVDRFNAPGSPLFCFLLSTRAGGLGINLATADTVIIYDSDWNPHNDIQAFSRAHRLGQTNKVMIYRFVTRKSVEERIIMLAKRKMMLTHLVVGGGVSKRGKPVLSKGEIDDILRFGASDLFGEDTEEGGADGARPADEEPSELERESGYSVPVQGSNLVYDDSAVANLLDRTQKGVDEKEDVANDYLSSFKVATFPTLETEVADEGDGGNDASGKGGDSTLAGPPGDYWEKLLRVRHEEVQAEMGKGKRQRKNVIYTGDVSGDESDTSTYSGTAAFSGSGSEVDEEEMEEMEEGEDEEGGTGENDVSDAGKARSKKKVKRFPLLATRHDSLEVLGFTQRQRLTFLRLVLKYGFNPGWERVFRRAVQFQRKEPLHIREYGLNFIQHFCEPENDAETYLDDVPKEGVDHTAVLLRVSLLHLVARKVRGVITAASARHGRMQGGALPAEPAASAKADVDDSKVKIEDSESGPASSSNHFFHPASADGVNTAAIATAAATAATAAASEAPGNSDKPKSNFISAMYDTTALPNAWELFHIADGGFTPLQDDWARAETHVEEGGWGRRADFNLLRGLLVHGYGAWVAMLEDPHISLAASAIKRSRRVSRPGSHHRAKSASSSSAAAESSERETERDRDREREKEKERESSERARVCLCLCMRVLMFVFSRDY